MTETPAPKKRGVKAGTKNALKPKEERATTYLQQRVTIEYRDKAMAYAESCGMPLSKLIIKLLDGAMIADKFKAQ